MRGTSWSQPSIPVPAGNAPWQLEHISPPRSTSSKRLQTRAEVNEGANSGSPQTPPGSKYAHKGGNIYIYTLWANVPEISQRHLHTGDHYIRTDVFASLRCLALHYYKGGNEPCDRRLQLVKLLTALSCCVCDYFICFVFQH